MSRLFPFRTATASDADEPRLVDISEEAADEVFAALASSTARATYKALHDEPRTASDLADVTDTTVQNVRYHLDNLQDADLVEVVDTWYSERGTEMKVYAPTDTSLVMFAGEDDDRATVWSVVRELVGGVGVLALASLFVQRLATEGTLLPPSGTPGGAPVGNDTTTADATTAAPTTTSAPTETVTSATRTTEATRTTVEYTSTEPATTTETVTTTAEAVVAGDAVAPGLVFFVGGFAVLLGVLAWRYAR